MNSCLYCGAATATKYCSPACTSNHRTVKRAQEIVGSE